MYMDVVAEAEIALHPSKLGEDIKEAIKESLIEKYEGTLIKDIGIFLAIKDIIEIGEGIIKPGDPYVYYTIKFGSLIWKPVEHEVVQGEVVDIAEYGAFVRIGAVDGFVHLSQIMDDYVNVDSKNMQIVGRESKRTLKVGDIVRAKIISISYKEGLKVTLTMRQPFLGATKWSETKAPQKATEKKKKAKKVAKKGGERKK